MAEETGGVSPEIINNHPRTMTVEHDGVFVSPLVTEGRWNNMNCVCLCSFPQTFVFTDGEDEKLRKRMGEHTHTHTQGAVSLSSSSVICSK